MKKSNLLLSIIIPVYNTELYLEECVESILNQQLDNYEIIFINDGSTDNSKEIMLNYQKEYPFVKYLEQENSGQGTARNVGIKQAEGKYIYFMDSDDYLVEGQLRKMLTKVSENDWDGIFFDGESFEHERPDITVTTFNYTRRKDYGFYPTGEWLLNDLSENNELIISPCLYIIKKEALEKKPLYFPAKYKHEDEFFTTTLFLYLEKVYHTKDVVFMRRIRESSTMTNTNKVPSFLGYVNVLSYFDQIYTQFDFETTEGKEAYRKKMKQITKSAYTSYSQIDNKKEVKATYDRLEEFTKKYHSFDVLTRLYIFVSKHPVFLNLYRTLVQTVKK